MMVKHSGATLANLIILLMLSVFVVACGTSPPVQYYSLQPVEPVLENDAENSIIVRLGPLRIPEYLKRPQIVTRTDNAEVIIDDFSRWTEPLDQAMHSVVASNLDSLLSDVIVIAYPYITAIDFDYWILGGVSRFDADENGKVTLIVQWGLMDSKRNTILAPLRRQFEAQTTGSNDP
ncbi:MAG TPA: PqiC family protein, partial [Gammaproteobacteria bacterium]